MKIAAVSGSLRKASLNTALLGACVECAPEGVEIVTGTIAGIPLYDGDLEAAQGIPAAVATLKALVTEADGFLIVTPEYNNSLPGVLKNAIDWMSRGGDMKDVFGGKPVAVIGASPGGFGTVLAQNAWLPVIKALGAEPWTGGRLMLSRAHTLLDPQGHIADEKTRNEITAFVTGFAAFAARAGGK